MVVNTFLQSKQLYLAAVQGSAMRCDETNYGEIFLNINLLVCSPGGYLSETS